MSYVFDIGDTTVWSPSLRIGHVFVSSVHALAQSLGVSSGFVANTSDHYIIELETFRDFVDVLATSAVRQPVMGELCRGVLVVALVMLERADIGPVDIGLPDEYMEAAHAIAHSMAGL